jgi:hypothetical protein
MENPVVEPEPEVKPLYNYRILEYHIHKISFVKGNETHKTYVVQHKSANKTDWDYLYRQTFEGKFYIDHTICYNTGDVLRFTDINEAKLGIIKLKEYHNKKEDFIIVHEE